MKKTLTTLLLGTTIALSMPFNTNAAPLRNAVSPQGNRSEQNTPNTTNSNFFQRNSPNENKNVTTINDEIETLPYIIEGESPEHASDSCDFLVENRPRKGNGTLGSAVYDYFETVMVSYGCTITRDDKFLVDSRGEEYVDEGYLVESKIDCASDMSKSPNAFLKAVYSKDKQTARFEYVCTSELKITSPFNPDKKVVLGTKVGQYFGQATKLGDEWILDSIYFEGWYDDLNQSKTLNNFGKNRRKYLRFKK